jgi:hypothetical protein
VPDIRVPNLEAHGGGKSIFKLVLEVALIGVGVFLGLAGEQWRERAHQRELAEQALHRFKTEITANRAAIASVKDYHAERLKELQAYFQAKPADRKNVSIQLTKSAAPAFLDRTAWDLAIATQSLSYLDSELAFSLSAIYNLQAVVATENGAFMQGMFVRPPSIDETAFFAALQAYFGDMAFFEPRLMTSYDDALQRIDKTPK